MTVLCAGCRHFRQEEGACALRRDPAGSWCGSWRPSAEEARYTCLLCGLPTWERWLPASLGPAPAGISCPRCGSKVSRDPDASARAAP